ncbi:MAG: hypothetical protein F6K14_07580 [Symploca sp. SIO2C1]|nr:hypothetical protein [Symploca sp. SIO2C1]
MKASEVLRKYKDGRRDFSGECLRGQSFQGENLAGADFSEADIRRANFTNAYLRGAKFCGAKAGLQRRWAVFLVVVLWMLSALSGIFSIWIGTVVSWALDTSFKEDIIAGIVSLIVPAVFLIFTMRKGLAAGFGAVAVIGAVTVAGFGAVVVAGGGVFVVPGAVAAGVAAGMAVAVALSGAYLGWRVLRGDQRDAWIRTIAIAFAATGGTTFRDADLTDADFTGARLKSTDFRRANLTRTCWRDASKLDQARSGNSYLQDTKVRELVITGDGQNQKYEQLPNLRGINLQGANLVGADFTGSVLKDGTLQGADLMDAILTVANLNKTNLQDTNLSKAKLKQAQLDGADLTGATLTGACIEDWGITTTTKLNGVRCDYVFMQLDNRNPHRKPDDWNKDFAEGEFVDFIAPMVLTLDLYHNRVDDPRLIAYAWQKLVEENPEAELELVSIEKRGKSKDKLLLKAETSPQAEHSVLHSEYFTNLQHLESLPREAKQALLRERGEMIRMLAGLLSTNRCPEVSINNHQTQEGDKNMTEIYKSKYDLSQASVGSLVDQAQSGSHVEGVGTQHNYAPEYKQNLAEAAAEIEQLLKQLDTTYSTATEAEKQSAVVITVQQEIKQNPTFKTRLRNALKEGGIEALKVLFAPIGIPIEMARGWIEAE